MRAMCGSEEIEYKFDEEDLVGFDAKPQKYVPKQHSPLHSRRHQPGTFVHVKFGSVGPVLLVSLNRVQRHPYGRIVKVGFCVSVLKCRFVCRFRLERIGMTVPDPTERTQDCSRFSYPETFDLADVGDVPSCKYELVSVMAHAGSAYMGHFVSYVRPFDRIHSNSWSPPAPSRPK